MSCLGCLFAVQDEIQNRDKAKKYAQENNVEVVIVKISEGWTFFTRSYAVETGIPFREMLTPDGLSSLGSD